MRRHTLDAVQWYRRETECLAQLASGAASGWHSLSVASESRVSLVLERSGAVPGNSSAQLRHDARRHNGNEVADAAR